MSKIIIMFENTSIEGKKNWTILEKFFHLATKLLDPVNQNSGINNHLAMLLFPMLSFICVDQLIACYMNCLDQQNLYDVIVFPVYFIEMHLSIMTIN